MTARHSPVVPAAGGRAPARLLAVTAVAGVLLCWSAGSVPARQSPGGWNAERQAVLPSGVAVRLDFEPLPGIDAEAAPGVLAGRTGDGAVYADGIRPGDPAETFRIAPPRPDTDGTWRELGSLRIAFSRPVRRPRLHVSGLTAPSALATGTTAAAARLVLTSAAPAGPALVARTPWAGWTVDGGTVAPPDDGAADAADGSGSLEVGGTVTAVTLRIDWRGTAGAGSTAPATALRTAFTVTVDESLGTAPDGYGNASHVLSDLFLGSDARGDSVRASGAAAGARPLVELAPGRPALWAAPVPTAPAPGRGDYRGPDPALVFPATTAAGDSYGLDVPVSTGGRPAVLAGWVDFDRDGRFDPTERVQAEVPAGAGAARLEWTVPEGGAAPGETWARLRIARDAAQLVSSGGYADSGEVLDQRIRIAPGPARPEITDPVPGAVTGEVRPVIAGTGGEPGAGVAVTADGIELCHDQAGRDGGWDCRPARPLGDGPHTLTAVETTRGGQEVRGEPVRLTVRTAPPAAPVLTLPEYGNDPGLLMTGVGEPGSTVSVTEPPGADRVAGELCSTGVAADGSWSCLPVESLADGVHRLTATAVDAAGHRTDGRPAGLTVDTVAPEPPVLASPQAGGTVADRPGFAGRAEPAATVTVAVRTGGGSGAALCSAVAAADGTWGCTAGRELAPGDVVLQATATDRAGNSTVGRPVAVHVAGAADPSPPPAATPVATPTGDPQSTVPSPPAAVPAGSGRPGAGGVGGASGAAETGASTTGGPLAPPPGAVGEEPGTATGRPAVRRAAPWLALCGGLLVAAGSGLLLSRLLAGGPGRRRRR